MSWWRFLQRARRDDDAARELQSYIEIETDENVARGLGPREAREAAHRKLGNVTRVREEIYLMNSLGPLDTWWQDFRYAIRLLRRDRSVATAAVLSLALGVGANTAIFQLLDAIRLRSLPVERPQELVEVRLAPGQSRTGSFNGRRPMWTYAQIQELRRHQQALSGLAVWSARRLNTAPGGEVKFVDGMMVSGDFFATLEVTPVLGRLFVPDDDRRGCAPSAVLSHAYWQRAFGGDPGVLSRTILLDGVTVPIIGVSAPTFFGVDVGRQYDVAVPLCTDDLLSTPSRLDRLDSWWLAVLGRLEQGWTVERASQHFQQLSPALFEATLPPTYLAEDAKRYLELRGIAEPAAAGVSGLRTDFADPLVLLLGITALVLVVACANLANLLLARATAREREIAARLAIGATRVRVIRQLLVESVVLAVLGAVAGAWLGHLLSRTLVAVLATNYVALFVDLTWNVRLFAFTAAVGTLACILFGVAPALRATAVAPVAALRSGGRGLTTSRERFGLRRILVVSQVSLSLVLIVGGLLFTRTFYNLVTTDPGFRTDDVLIATLSQLPDPGSPEAAQASRQELARRLERLPEVASVVEAAVVPLSQESFWNEIVLVDGRAPAEKRAIANFNSVGAGFFEMVGIPLLSGRVFGERDVMSAPAVAVVSEEFVRQFVPGGAALGRTLQIETPPGQPVRSYEIVGVVADTKYGELRDGMDPLVYLAAAQEPDPGTVARFIFRPRGAPESLAPAIVREVRSVSPGVFLEFLDWGEAIDRSVVRERLMAALSAAFGIVAAVLAAVGLYGLMSYTVMRRTQEIGLRLAIGASRRSVLTLVLGEAAGLVVVGVVVGGVLAALAARSTASLLYGLDPGDPASFALAPLGLLLVGLLAASLPARRASRVDPAIALRDE
jgi:predicted permease